MFRLRAKKPSGVTFDDDKIISFMRHGGADGYFSSSRQHAPATYGAETEVPLILRYVEFAATDTTSTPRA